MTDVRDLLPMLPDRPAVQTYTAVARSQNRKIGRIPAISRPQWSCPTDCPLMGAGCYGETKPGRPSIFAMVDKSIAAQARKAPLTMRDLATRAWRTVPRGLRFGVVGDYLTPIGTPDHAYIAETNELAQAQSWVPWGYTHAWRRLSPTLFRYIVRASVQSAEEAEEAIAAGWRVAIVDPGPAAPDTLIGSRISGQRVVQCPVTTGKSASCEDCLLCGRDIPTIIAFPTHGALRRRASDAVRRVRAAGR
jgi:hypothetical protein